MLQKNPRGWWSIRSWLLRNILSISNAEEMGQKRYIDANGSSHTHFSEQTLVWEKKRKKNETEGKTWTQCFEIYFCVFSSAFPISVFEVYDLAGSLKSKSAAECSSCLFVAFFSLWNHRLKSERPSSLWGGMPWNWCGNKQTLTLGLSWASLFLSQPTCDLSANLVSLLSKYFRIWPLLLPPLLVSAMTLLVY